MIYNNLVAIIDPLLLFSSIFILMGSIIVLMQPIIGIICINIGAILYFSLVENARINKEKNLYLKNQ